MRQEWPRPDGLKGPAETELEEADDMDNDDRQVGQILGRREALKILGAALVAGCVPGSAQPTGTPRAGASYGAVATALPTGVTEVAVQTGEATSASDAAVLPACVVRPELTEGPYFVDERLNRSDIRSDPGTGVVEEGALLALIFRVSQVGDGSCIPLEGAWVDIWHCNALGVYSDVSDPGFDTGGQQFLRGYQVTDANGVAVFTTIYPGWYSGRTVHIHFKIRTGMSERESSFYDFTAQLFFGEALSDRVHAQQPYADKGYRDTLNNQDRIYDDQLLLTVSESAEGYAAVFDIGLQID
jgi:protocatechuate 3,4-dioxygenase beta subunit